MTTGILEALTQLFALFAAGRTSKEELIGRQAANRYLRGRLPKQVIDHYLGRYDHHLSVFQLKGKHSELSEAKRLAKLSTKLLRICININKELSQKDKCVVYLRLLEFVKSTHGHPNSVDFIDAVCDSLLIDRKDVEGIHHLVNSESIDFSNIEGSFVLSKSEGVLGLIGTITGYKLANDTLFLIKYQGEDVVFVNNQLVPSGTVAIMAPGSVFRGNASSRIFFSDLVRRFLDSPELPKISFSAKEISHYFSFPTDQALHQFNITEQEGNLVGIMGGSGSGKSTFLNVLNGSIKPTFGEVTLNGIDIHKNSDLVQGTIGHIAQEDALIAELSVRENLRYSAKLTFGGLKKEDIEAKIEEILKSLGLWETRDLRVGSILDKTISGGQRKRLNIALELIREPLVLFVDEPTSGLSSHDSEQIIDLLKEMTHRGKLVFAVIHQPSSDIFKLFDKLFILDQGGYPIYYGDPVSTVTYFKELTNQVDPDHAECHHCGNISPEQIFDTVEARTVDEFGNNSDTRRISPKEWNDFYNVIIGQTIVPQDSDLPRLEAPNTTPTIFSQFKTYFTRDLHSKRINRQYLLINLLEAPMLAALLSIFMRYNAEGVEYIYRTSENMPQFLFISVIVALFLGLSVSAEEIHRDRALLRRECFLYLNWGSYIQAKIAVSFIASALQTIGFVIVSHIILGIPDLFWVHCLVLFSVSTFGNLIGMNISAAFKSAKVIYMIIPLLIIPQIIFGGAIVRFDRFNHWFTHPAHVPLLGDVMVSRWGFEALAVHSYRENAYAKNFSDLEDIIRHSSWRRDFWLQMIVDSDRDTEWINREWERASEDLIGWDIVPPKSIKDIQAWENAFSLAYHEAFNKKDMIKTDLKSKGLLKDLSDNYRNDEIAEWVLQEERTVRIIDLDEGSHPTSAPIHHPTRNVSGWNAQYFAPSKKMFGFQVKTLYYNVIVLWLMTILAWACLRWMPYDTSKSFKVSR